MSEFHRFQVGKLSCIAIGDGDMNYPVDRMFKDMPLEKAEQLLAQRGLPVTHVNTPYALLYVDTGENKVLIDNGVGKYGEPSKAIFSGIDHSQTNPGILLENFHKAGVNPQDIDTIFFTHAHPDHIGGSFDTQGRPIYANANTVICKEEWDFWFSDERLATYQVPPPFIEIARENLEPLRDRMTFLNGHKEFLPGLTAVPMPGHTPGHMGVAIESEGERLMHISDAVLLPIHLELPGVVPQLDVIPEQSLETRKMICDRLAEENWLVFAHHYWPFPNLGTIEKSGAGWRWRPIAIS